MALRVIGEGVPLPVPDIFLSAHIIFKSQGRLVGQKRQHESRRRKGKNLYNKQWRDLLLGAMLYLADGGDKLLIPTGGDTLIQVDGTPVSFKSAVGYDEPTKDMDVEEDAELEEVEEMEEMDV